jgi:hypothetical protein
VPLWSNTDIRYCINQFLPSRIKTDLLSSMWPWSRCRAEVVRHQFPNRQNVLGRKHGFNDSMYHAAVSNCTILLNHPRGIHQTLAQDTPIVVRFRDDIRVGQREQLTYRPATRGSQPRHSRSAYATGLSVRRAVSPNKALLPCSFPIRPDGTTIC